VIVCPACRNANDEERTTCERCGASLEPGPAMLVSGRRSDAEREPIEIPQPRGPSRWRGFALLGVIAAVAIGAGLFLLLRPDPCGGTNFTSSNFGYCLTVPDGWTAEEAQVGSSATLDQFSVPAKAATVLVEAVDLQQDATLETFSRFVQQKDEDAGLTPGRASDTRIDGVDARQWDITVSASGGATYTLREVVFVSRGWGWRVQFNDLASDFDGHESGFSQLLGSWRFR
jgi:hypothetical protein